MKESRMGLRHADGDEDRAPAGTAGRFPGERRYALAVFAGCLAALVWGAATPRPAAVWIDPVLHIPAQDEATYGASAFDMARGGDWLTPHFMGRIILEKPPLLFWLEAVAAKVVGEGAWALRIPSLLAGAATATLLFLWVLREGGSLLSAIGAAVLLCASQLFFVMSRVGMMDALLVFCSALAVYQIPRFESEPRAAARFGLAAGAAVLTKSVAGVLPWAVLFAWFVCERRLPNWKRLGSALGLCAAVGLPWFAWQLYLHPVWFWTEHVRGEILNFGLGAIQQDSDEGRVAFYLRRLALDPVLASLAAVGLFRKPNRLVVVWGVMAIALALLYPYRAARYLLPAIPAMGLLAARAIPPKWLASVAAAAFLAKLTFGSSPWGLPYRPEFEPPTAAAIERYVAMKRSHEFIEVGVDDQFYAPLLGLPRVRYAAVAPGVKASQFGMDFFTSGIMIRTADFARLDDLRPEYLGRLRAMGQDTGDPTATVIFAENEDEMGTLIRSRPSIDFLAPAAWASRDAGTHRVEDAGMGLVFLLAKP